MVDAWFEHISSQEHRLGPDERQSLKDFLNGLTSADEAAKAISSAYSTLPGTAIGSFVCDLWLLLIDAAKEIPSSQDKLVQLVATIGQLSDFTRCGKVFRVAGPEKQRPWRDPPLFADLVGEKSCEFSRPTFTRRVSPVFGCRIWSFSMLILLQTGTLLKEAI